MNTNRPYGTLPTGAAATLYTITGGGLTAQITDFGATLVRLYVPDRNGMLADVVLGHNDVNGYANSTAYFGATIGRNANRVGGASFLLNGKRCELDANEGPNNLHSGHDSYAFRFWEVSDHQENSITFRLESPNGDQGFPGNAEIFVTYSLEASSELHIRYNAVSDADTVFNLTNHSYFNLAGHENTDLALRQELTLPGRHYTCIDSQSIPTGELASVNGTPMDFRAPKAIGADVDMAFDALRVAQGYDHNFEAFCNPCAILHDPTSGRTMAVSTDCPGIQFYSGNYLDEKGKDGVHYTRRSGIALETQFYPDSVNNPAWVQPFVKAGQPYKSETIYRFL